MRKMYLIISIFLISLILSGCAEQISQSINSPKDDTIITDVDIPFQLKINDIRLISSENLKIKLVNVIEDSRCASDVVCAWQGQVTAVVNILKDEKNIGDFNLISRVGEYEDLAIKNLYEYSIKLIKVEPYPISTQKIKMNEYVVTLVVSKI